MDIQLSIPHEQFEVGILAFFFGMVILSGLFIFRFFSNNSKDLNNHNLWGILAGQYVFMIAMGIYLYLVTESVIILCLCLYGPIIFYCLFIFYAKWTANDYYLYIQSPPGVENELQQQGKHPE